MRLHHLALWSRRIELLRDFYTTYFDGRAGEKYENPAKGFESYFVTFADGVSLELMRRTDVTAPDAAQHLGLAHFAFGCESRAEVDRLTERLRADGHPVLSEPRTTGDGYYESAVGDPTAILSNSYTKHDTMNPKTLRIVFMGTPEFAVPSLRRLVAEGYNVVGAVTVPDKPAGRGRHLRESDVKIAARELGVPVLQPEKFRDPAFLDALQALQPDLGIVIAFKMLPEVVWAMPRLGTFNLHASLLPEYRGAAPINWAIINGERETGITTFLLNHEIDKGAILAQERVAIAPEDNVGTLYERLMLLGAELVTATVDRIAAGDCTPAEQMHFDESRLHPAPKIFKEDCRIDWRQPGERIVNLVRGLSPYPTHGRRYSRRGSRAIRPKSSPCISNRAG